MDGFELNDAEKVGTLTLRSKLMVDDVAGVKEVLLEATEKCNHLVLDISTCERIDLSFLQLFCSLHKTMTRLHKTVTLRCNNSDRLKSLFVISGFANRRGCDFNADGKCLWIKEGGNE